MTTIEAARWRVASASVRGAAHDRTGLPNQDAVAVAELPGALVAAVADGHGGARYVRSDRGARFAVDAAISVATRWIGARPAGAPPPSEAEARADLLPPIIGRWRDAVRQDLATGPFAQGERERAGVPLDDDPLVAYGATLLLAVVTTSGTLLAGLGDGDVIVVGTDGEVASPLPADDRLVAGQTTSLCLPDSERDVRYAVVGAGGAELILLASDGYGNSFAAPDWRREVATDLRAQVAERGFDHVAAALPGWLADSAAAGGDDVTVALLSVRGASPSSALTPPPIGPPATRPPTGPGPRPVRAAALIAVGLLVGTAAGWVAWGRSPGSPTPVATPPAVTASTVPPSTPTTPPATVPSAELSMAVANGGTVSFLDDPVGPNPRWSDAAAPTVAITRVRAGDRVWEITDRSGLSVRDTRSGRTTAVNLSHGAGSLLWHDDVLWVVDADGRSLSAVDTTDVKVLGTATVARTVQAQPGGTGGGGGPAGTG